MKKILFIIVLFASLGCVTARADEQTKTPQDSIYLFRFVPERDMFYIPWQGNDTQLHELTELINAHRSEILAGKIPVTVNGYCTSMPTPAENLHTVAIRSNRVKSELILHAELQEECFVTRNHVSTYKGMPDVVTVTLRIPVAEQKTAIQPEKKKPAMKEPVAEAPKTETIAPQTEQTKQQPEQTEPVLTTEPTAEIMPASVEPIQPYCFAVRTNVLYDALLTPTLGVEWRINRSVGVKLDGSLAWWSSNQDKVQKIWLLNPEVRWYLLRDKRFYAGVSGNFGDYNIYRYMLGNILSKETGYQGKMWGAGLTVGYQLLLSHNFSIDFNLGLGYTRFDYDSFSMTDGVRVYKDRDKTKNCWGPTQAGINLVWTIGGNK